MNKELSSAFRSLWRVGMTAALSTKFPGHRFVYRDLLRDACRKHDPSYFSQERVLNTVMFLQAASSKGTLEHKLMKNRFHIQMFRRKEGRRLVHLSSPMEREYFVSVYDTYEACLKKIGQIYDIYLL
ncbi:mitochondrial LYR family protein [Schizosaccharomyces osmophilus]|uniref:Mitochondrial LYR family protein n=1 Tax=Schizosaccharomyces osmophilus TaxID=2545709 RepID=A0AAF0AX96_9SCHI|nr:mitochondrial LYR family protein [Schizosaccharomyces osmophilus]WBW74043.1 mitochondrial LYR family protein [Schizosaccharomyces osmophilus]